MVTFKAHIKQISIKECVSGDSTTRITVEMDNISESTMAALNAVRADEKNKSHELTVTIEA